MARTRRSISRPRLAVLAALPLVGASIAAAHALSAGLGLGSLSEHMLQHIALINVAAAGVALIWRAEPAVNSGASLAAATATQIVLLWIWHLPPVFDAAVNSHSLHLAMGASLFFGGLWFWTSVLSLSARDRWQGIFALLATGKLFCLFAAVLVFAPRVLYSASPGHHHGVGISLEDQQLAGLIMISICPLAYVATGVVIAAKWLLSMEAAETGPRTPAIAGPRIVMPLRSLPLLILLSVGLGGCVDAQSVLSPASPAARDVFNLTVVLIAGGGLIAALVMGVLAAALFAGERARARIAERRTIVLGGILLPSVVLTALIVYGAILQRASAASPETVQEIDVAGEQWWWRVTYHDEQLLRIPSANEIRVEVGRPIRINLTSRDVIHSFWVPNLGGKVDLIPGKTNHIEFTAMEPGTYRGQCAEYCGGPHALMAVRVVAMAPDDYAHWLDNERQDAAEPTAQLEVRGKQVFMQRCVVCHAVRGTPAGGRLGPDLTHVAGRARIGAEVLPTSEHSFAAWIVGNEAIKPNNKMPEFTHLPSADLAAVAAYLASLR